MYIFLNRKCRKKIFLCLDMKKILVVMHWIFLAPPEYEMFTPYALPDL